MGRKAVAFDRLMLSMLDDYTKPKRYSLLKNKTGLSDPALIRALEKAKLYGLIARTPDGYIFTDQGLERSLEIVTLQLFPKVKRWLENLIYNAFVTSVYRRRSSDYVLGTLQDPKYAFILIDRMVEEKREYGLTLMSVLSRMVVFMPRQEKLLKQT